MSAIGARTRTLCSIAAIVAVLALAGCGGGSGDPGGSNSGRPTTDARIQILEPAANQVTGPDTNVQLNLIGAQVVDRTTGPLTPTEGHIHLSVDQKLVSMAYGTTQEVKGLTPGPHTVQAEFVATDHAPFANRVVAAVQFNVAPPDVAPPVVAPAEGGP